MVGAVYTAVVAVPVAAGMIRSRRWLAGQVSGRLGMLWCALAALCVGALPALIVGVAAPDGWAAWKRHLAYVLLAAPVVAAGVLLFRRGSAAPAAAAAGAAAPGTTDSGTAMPAATAPASPAPAAPAAAPAAPAASPQGTGKGHGKLGQGSPVKVVRDGGAVAPAPRKPQAPATVTPPEPAEDRPDSSRPQDSPTTVTECVLAMSISCEEYILQNFVQMASAPLPETQRDTIRRLVEETDDKLARLRAARLRHHGEEVVRVTWSQLPEVDLPVVKPGSSVEQVREKAMKQTQVMIDFYRTVAAYVMRPSLKSLLVNLALDGQRHLAVIEQTST